jgi:hypothetical protein
MPLILSIRHSTGDALLLVLFPGLFFVRSTPGGTLYIHIYINWYIIITNKLSKLTFVK